ncbi:hypothetical protein [Desulfotruncus alcoholivorax]|uniref:hypothetical protein n=1 Tax=Desulfotruncus alcoholivorax TaxID=265477 RepID=UPI000421ABEB|nr:hypothetical protein [Desulfotruncus alcoholivorax]
MAKLNKFWLLTLTIAVIVAFAAGCGSGGSVPTQNNAVPQQQQQQRQPQQQAAASQGVEQPVAPEKNPPGDIPDTQVFVNYSPASGIYKIDVPEGWARTVAGDNATFQDKLDGLSIEITKAAGPITEQSVLKDQVPALKKAEHAVQVQSVSNVKLAGGPAVLVVYTSNSLPDPVTDKKVRLENNRYFYYQKGKLAVLNLYAPQGADNVDQWKRISDSFRWQ